VCWSEARLTDINRNLDDFFGAKGLVEFIEPVNLSLSGLAEVIGAAPLIGIVETRERAPGGAVLRAYATWLSRDRLAAPTVQLVTPAAGQTVGGAVLLQATGQDRWGTVARIEFYVDAEPSPVCVDAIPRSSGSIFQCTWDSRGGSNGLHSLRARAYNPAGESADSAAVTVGVDNGDIVPPASVQVQAPTSGQAVTGLLELQPTATDAAGTIARIEFYLDSDATPTCADATPKPSGATFACSWDSASGADGPHTVRARAFDPSGNVTESAPVSFTTDNSSVTLSVSIEGAGMVTSSLAGLVCSAGTCTARFQRGSLVPLLATPAPGWRLASWTGACTGVSACAITLDASKSVLAAFSDAPSPVEGAVPSPIYRFFNTLTGTHFYTISEAEKASILAGLPQLRFEDVAFYAYAQPVPGGAPVYRFYNILTGTHFYTISEAEKDSVLATLAQFHFEGVAFYAYAGSVAGSTPVYRFYNTVTRTHFYTVSAAEREWIIATLPHFGFEGVAYYVPPAP
jgi:hypothetical protein